MKSKVMIVCLMLSLFSIGFILPVPPQSVISNGLITARLYLPDANNGYYQATRFDWSGLVAELKYKDHTFFGQWFEQYSPKTHDAVSGPVESFSPIGYEETKPGGTFIGIGVGLLRKPVEKSYRWSELYEIVDGGKWTVKTKKDRVIFIQKLHDSTGYSYSYSKTVRLVKNKPEMVLEHSLKNTGTKVIETDVFDHNFPLIDKEPTGPAMKVIFPFNIEAEGKGWDVLAETKENEINFLRLFNKKESVYSSGLQGFGNTAKDYEFKIQNQKTGAGIKVTCDWPLDKMVFWACSTTACPEPYIKLKVMPGEEIKWNIHYEFYTFSPEIIPETK
ncbi:MAG TPA: hypothetical protein VGN20_13660 [Mucilaginibacter sp.]|jgi:hypothetical protein